MSQAHLVYVEFEGEAHGKAGVKQLPTPSSARVTWSTGRRDVLTLEHFVLGASRDVYASAEAPYVLKVQPGRWYESSNAQEDSLGRSSFAVLAPQIYGAVQTKWKGVPLSVLVAERVPHDYLSFCQALLLTPPNALNVKMLLDLVAAFFLLVVQGAGQLGYQLKDLHWKNLGITVDQAPNAQTRATRPGSALEHAHAPAACDRGASGCGARVCAVGGSRCH